MPAPAPHLGSTGTGQRAVPVVVGVPPHGTPGPSEPHEASSASQPECLAEITRGTFTARAFAAMSPPHRGTSEVWPQSLSHACYDHRYFDLLAGTITDRFTHLRIELSEGSGAPRAAQPAFLVREDLLLGAPAAIRRAGNLLRHAVSGALTLNMLMIGNATGEGVLAGGDGETGAWTARALAATLPALGRELGASLVVFKDFPISHRGVLDSPLASAGFARLPSMPGATIDLAGFKDFEAYLAKAHSRSRRADLRRKFRDAAGDSPETRIDMEVCSHLGDLQLAAQAHALYQNVYDRATLQFERLTPEFLLELGRAMPDRARFFLWRRAGRLVAVNFCMLHDTSAGRMIKDNYIGLDYSLALDLHLYFLSWRDIIDWSIRNGVTQYWTAPLNYGPKLDLKMRLAPLDLYVRHVSPLFNPVARRVIPAFGPTRGEKTLPRFENFSDLH